MCIRDRYVVQDAAGKTTNSQLFAFTNFVSVVGVPGGTPTAAKPDTMSIAEVKITNQLTGKTCLLYTSRCV